MDISKWSVTVGTQTTDQNNKVNVPVTYIYTDGEFTKTFPDSYSGVLSNDNLLQIIQENLTAHDQTIQALLNAPSIVTGAIDLTQLFPQPVETPAPVLAVKTQEVVNLIR